MKTFKTVLEYTANILIVIVASMILYRFLAPPAHFTKLAKGQTIKAARRYVRGERSLLLFLGSRCQYCDASAEFYRGLAKGKLAAGVSITAVFRESSKQGEAYLRSNGLDWAAAGGADFAALRVEGTPTVALFDSAGTVLDSWEGKLGAGEQDRLIKEIQR